ncbi:hypothetical protein MMC27_004700 [Xylographa pallens]|nr:hypothetical protein [Xylographa pallens]
MQLWHLLPTPIVEVRRPYNPQNPNPSPLPLPAPTAPPSSLLLAPSHSAAALSARHIIETSSCRTTPSLSPSLSPPPPASKPALRPTAEVILQADTALETDRLEGASGNYERAVAAREGELLRRRGSVRVEAGERRGAGAGGVMNILKGGGIWSGWGRMVGAGYRGGRRACSGGGG